MKRKFIWITNPHYKYSLAFIKEHPFLFTSKLQIFVSSCNKKFASYFETNGFESARIAREAVLFMDKNHFNSKSLKELINRGKRHGTVKEIKFSFENQKQVDEFKKLCAHGNEPQLKYLFSNKFEPNERLFVLENKNKDWLGAITISNFKEKVFTDLILRKSDAPVGIMEALIFDIYEKLKEEKFFYWSLGDVPFVVYDYDFPSKEFLINFLGRRFKYAYNYSGLYNFKNKFNPVWYDSYLCCKPRINLKALIQISKNSNFTKLVLYKLFKK